jgi:hypothetical protein
VPRFERQLHQYSHIVESMWDNPDFIQAGFHIGQYITPSVSTEAKQEHIKALYSSMKNPSELIDVSIFTSSFLFVLKFDSLLM